MSVSVSLFFLSYLDLPVVDDSSMQQIAHFPNLGTLKLKQSGYVIYLERWREGGREGGREGEDR